MPEVTLTVLAPGVLTSIQDAGRRGLAFYGIPQSGWLDQNAARHANHLAGNPVGAPLLECNLTAPRLKFNADCRLALTGADMGWELDSESVPRQLIEVAAGAELSGGPATTGARAYIAIRGLLNCLPVHDSVATDLTTGIGGLDGRRLEAGDELVFDVSESKPHEGDRLAEFVGPPRPGSPIGVLPGPEWNLLSTACRARITESEFSISPDSNRMGARLVGAKLESHNIDLPSVPVVPGVIQLPPSGQPIVILQDGPTTGGYPRIAVIPEAELGRFNQIRPGQEFRFQPRSVDLRGNP